MKRVQNDVARLQRAVRRRRTHDAAFKRQLIELTLAPRASVAQIALDHRLNANLLFKWRRDHLRSIAQALVRPAAAMLPVTVVEPEDTAQAVSVMSARRSHASSLVAGSIEIDLPLGRVRLKGGVNREALRVVIDVLSRR